MIHVEQLSKRYAHAPLLQELSLRLDEREVVAVTGASGAGKTTLLRLIAGLERPDEGRILIDELEASTPSRLIAPHARRLSLIFQDLALWPHMSAAEHVAFALARSRKDPAPRRAAVADILSLVRLAGFERRYPCELSGGEKQRLAIARALAGAGKYLLMDEPFCHLDAPLRSQLQQVVVELKTRLGLGILYVTHQLDEARAVADRVLILREGRLVDA